MVFARTLKRTEYRAPDYFENGLGERVEGDLLTAQLLSQDGKCFGQMSAFVQDFVSPDTSLLIEEMYKTVEASINKNPDLYCRCGETKTGEIELKANEFRANNIV